MRLIALLALLVAGPAFAGTKILSLTPATGYTIGTSSYPFQTGDLRDTLITYGICSGTQPGTVNRGTLSLPPGIATIITPDLPAGSYCWNAVTRLNQSAFPSNTVQDSAPALGPSFTISSPPAQGNPPTNLVVTSPSLVAYGSQQSDERQVTYPVGTVAANTPCDGSMSANGLYRVPKSAVTWAGTVKPAVVFASCQPSGG